MEAAEGLRSACLVGDLKRHDQEEKKKNMLGKVKSGALGEGACVWWFFGLPIMSALFSCWPFLLSAFRKKQCCCVFGVVVMCFPLNYSYKANR